MSAPIEETNGDITQGQSVEDNTTGTGNADSQPVAEQQSEGHPAWKEILDLLPDEFHPLVTPKLKGWDDGVQTRFQNLQSQYEPYKPFIENEVDPEYLQQAIGLAAAIEQDPQRVYNALAEAYGYGQGVADTTGATGADTDEDSDPDDPVAARLAEHERMLEQMAEAFLADTNSREDAENQKALDSYMSSLHEAYDKVGGFDENYVLTQIANGVDGRKAVESFQDAVKKFSGGAAPVVTGVAGSQAPPVMGGSGGLPSNRTDPSTLSDADTGKLVAEMLKAANEE